MRSLARFYQLFIPAFTLYSIAWIVGWIGLRGHPGSLAGLLAGTVLMGGIFALAFQAKEQMLKVIAALLGLNTAGYLIGGWVAGWITHLPQTEFFGVSLAKPQERILTMMSWGLFYGLGAGLGFAFHWCQAHARQLIAAS